MKWYNRPMSDGQQIALMVAGILIMAPLAAYTLTEAVESFNSNPGADHIWESLGDKIKEQCELAQYDVGAQTVTFKCPKGDIVFPISSVKDL